MLINIRQVVCEKAKKKHTNTQHKNTERQHSHVKSKSVCVCVSPEAAAVEPHQNQRLKLKHLEQVCVLVCARASLCVPVCVAVVPYWCVLCEAGRRNK